MRTVKFMYFAPTDVLIPRVDRVSIMRCCEGTAEIGWDVELVTLKVRLESDEPTRARNLFEVYGVSDSFRVTMLPSGQRQLRKRPRLLAAWRAVCYPAIATVRLLLQREAFRHDVTVLYCKNYLVALGLLPLRLLLGRRAVLLFEAHVPPARRVNRTVLGLVNGILPVSSVLARELEYRLAVPRRRILVAHHGVNLPGIERARVSKAKARSILRLPEDRRLVVYTGKVDVGLREIDYLIEAAKLLPHGAEMVIVGGRDDRVRTLREKARSEGMTDIRFVGFVAPADVYTYQSAADVLVTYYPGNLSINRYRASPAKLFEYMAARRPIVTADYPALRELLSSSAAVFVERDRPDLLAKAISSVLSDDARAEGLARQAYQDVQRFTWRRRAERVQAFVERLVSTDGAAEWMRNG